MRQPSCPQILSLLIRSSMCGHPNPFRSVRDLGPVPVRCSRPSGMPEGRSSRWLPAWLPVSEGLAAWFARHGPSAFQAGRIRSWQEPSERYALSPTAAGCQWSLLLLSPLPSISLTGLSVSVVCGRAGGMDVELIARISPGHRDRLVWFEEHQGEVSPVPGRLAGRPLASPFKGIYKPADLPYALSVKLKLNSRYKDGVPVPTPGGGWLLEYHEEDPRSGSDTTSANEGLKQCIANRIPVGVLCEQAPARYHARYDRPRPGPTGATRRSPLLLREP